MYKGQKISVALATYNGEKYIKEQLESIIDQTVMVDEIVISDDGSKDNTIPIIRSIQSENPAIHFVLLTDNTKHGAMGNFEHSLVNCTGNYIFLADQDDVWHANKAEEVIKIFLENPDADLVCHDAELIDKNGDKIPGEFNRRINGKTLNIDLKDYKRLAREVFLEKSVSWTLTNGMVMCVTKRLIDQAIPFPDTKFFHDAWLAFLALKNNTCYYLNEVLTMYRLHGDNTGGNNAYTGTVIDKCKKIVTHYKQVRNSSVQTREMYYLSVAMRDVLDPNDINEKQAYDTACTIINIGKELLDIESSNRLTGSMKLISLYKHNMRYRNSGKNAFLIELAFVLLNSKKKRLENLMNYRGKNG